MSKRPTSGHVTTRLPKAPRGSKRALAQGSPPSMLTDPAGGWFGRGPYRDAAPTFWAAGSSSILFAPSLTSANRDIVRHRDQAVSNAREVDRNNQFINSGLTKRAVNTVGASLRLQYMPNWDALGIDGTTDEAVDFVQTVENHFSLWAEDFRLLCDAHRQGQFGALMLLAARESLGTEGETLCIIRYDEERMDRYRGDYATFVEVVSCDRLSTPMNYVENNPLNPKIIAGREVDEYGAAVAFHVRTTHPSDVTGVAKWERVVRETEWGRPVGVHFFLRHRAGQQRNMPTIIQSLRSVKMLDKFDDAQLQAAVVNAILSIFIESEGTAEEILMKLTQSTPAGGKNIIGELWDKRFNFYENNELLADGVRIPVLPPGDKITMSTSSRASADTKDFRSAFLRGMAAQLNLTYEQFSGDYSETTFSSARAAMIDMWRLVTVDRILFTQHVAYPIFVAFFEELFVRADELAIKWPAGWPEFYDHMTAYTQCEFRGPGMGWVDPLKDAQAAKSRQEQGLTSPTYEAAQQGQSFTDNVDAIARDHEYARKRGVAVPGMPEFAALQRAAKEDPNAEASGGADPNEPKRDSNGEFDGSEDSQEKQDEKRRAKKKETTDE